MAKNRNKTNLYHIDKSGNKLDVSREKSTGRLFIKGTDQEVESCRVKAKNKGNDREDNYDYSKPMFAQELGDEWDHYAWTADDF